MNQHNSIIAVTDGTEMVRCITLFHPASLRHTVEKTLTEHYNDTPTVWNLVRRGNLFQLRPTPDECNYMSDYIDMLESDRHFDNSMSRDALASAFGVRESAFLSTMSWLMPSAELECSHPARWEPMDCTIGEMIVACATNDPSRAMHIYMHDKSDDGTWHHLMMNENNGCYWEALK